MVFAMTINRMSRRVLLILALFSAGCASSPPLPPPAPVPELKLDTHPLPLAQKDVPPAAQAVAEEVPANPVLEENNIYFRSGSTQVDAAGEQKLRLHASRLAENRKAVVTLIGLTDDQGSRSFNLVIAEQRIEAVARILRANGVLRNQLRFYARGNKAPDQACKTPACREKMRRVELDYRE